MSEPNMAGKEPKMMDLEPGEYHWCSCGKSAGGDFCSGAHEGSDFTPVAFEVKEKANLAICMCKHTKTPPYCDGSHQNL